MLPGMGAGMNPRQMSMMMKKLGIDVRELGDVEEVVIRTPATDYVFRRPSVSVMKAQGTETWQVSGTPQATPRASGTSAAPGSNAGSAPSSKSAATAPAPKSGSPPASAPAAASGPAFTDDDVALVAEKTGASPAKARATLTETGGDIAEAIVRLM